MTDQEHLVKRGMQIVGRLLVEHDPNPPTAMLHAFNCWWDSHGEKWKRLMATQRRDYLNTFAAGYAAAPGIEPHLGAQRLSGESPVSSQGETGAQIPSSMDLESTP